MRVNFRVGLKKKIPLSVPRQSTGLRPGPSRSVLTWAMVALCMGGAGVKGFVDPYEKVFLVQYLGAVIPRQEFFF